jgi:hypothetical protein
MTGKEQMYAGHFLSKMLESGYEVVFLKFDGQIRITVRANGKARPWIPMQAEMLDACMLGPFDLAERDATQIAHELRA